MGSKQLERKGRSQKLASTRVVARVFAAQEIRILPLSMNKRSEDDSESFLGLSSPGVRQSITLSEEKKTKRKNGNPGSAGFAQLNICLA
jgi:hypothetical protein